MDLIARIERRGRETPDRVAHQSGARSMTWGELLRRSRALAAWLATHLPDDASPVVVRGHKEPEMLVAFLACARTRHPYVPLDTGLPPARAERIVALARAPLTLEPERIAALSAGDHGEPPVRAVGPDDPHYIMFTSGSTGDPKGVPITRGNLEHFLAWMLAEQRPADGGTWLNQCIFGFDVSHMDSYLCLLTGGTLVSVTKEQVADLKQLFAMLGGSGVTEWVSTPAFAQLCLVEKRFARGMLPAVRKFLFCGEALPPDTVTQLLDRFPGAEVWNTYGPTEATIATTSLRVDRDVVARYTPLPIGRPMLGSRVVILDAERRPVPEGERGEIVIAGPNVSPGYLHRPDLTEKAFFRFEGAPAYRTGDWGHVRDGLLFCEGRMDFQVKLHGHRIELGDIEANLCALPGVAGAAVLPVAKDGRVDALAAYVLLADAAAGTEREKASRLREALAARVPAYMVPRKFHFVAAFPMTPNGKIDRQALAARP
ncbi:MAG: D-alanine--poly(phosphoribitol) ligase subunit DltA [Gemmatimonadetes bacterium]|jgi:D-alanine--poly(phosphoribitol) ligase subunit 1|nr:D-alanine--poly(phosphoribitol) ligase subunit DltA [Gemmatimonadota bacterium]MBK7785714.1 D-alanine--poly(phosphoribitol) ligase subunit DltA [Gemmatimonadota bacterium]